MPYSLSPTPDPQPMLNQGRLWVFVGAAALAGTAGYINTVMLGFFAVPVSHMSGAVAMLGVDMAARDWNDLLLVASIVAGFLLGALLSGLIIGNASLRPGRRYGAALTLEGALLLVATALAMLDIRGAVPLAALACGLQNAMASSYRGLILRTTHVSGVVTDIGALLGNRLRGRQIKLWKLALLLTLLVAFFVGGLLGAVLVLQVGMVALGVAGLGCLLAGLAYFLFLLHTHPGRY